jgi:hypothetical protein
MEFCLFYQGELPSNGDKKEKHRIRKALAPQLKTLWEQEPLMGLWQKRQKDNAGSNTLIRKVGSESFLPLVTGELYLHAEVFIDLIRPGAPGALVHSGDIDNRLKTLFDALRMPNDVSELVVNTEETDVPIYCLLEDDRLITRVDVASHQLLIEVEPKEVILVIKLNVKSTQKTWDNIGI